MRIRSHEEIIMDLEDRAAKAFLTKDYDEIRRLAHPDIIYKNEAGRIFTSLESMDLMHPEKFHIESLLVTDKMVRIFNNVAITNITNTISGKYMGIDFKGDFIYTRTWIFMNGKWLVIAGTTTKL